MIKTLLLMMQSTVSTNGIESGSSFCCALAIAFAAAGVTGAPVRAIDEPDEGTNRMVVKIPVSFTTSLQGASSPPGTTVKARIDGTLSLGPKVIAPQGSLLVGHLEMSDCMYKKESLMRVTFSCIETPSGKRFPVKGTLRPQLRTFSSNNTMKHAHIDDDGCLIELMPLFMADKERFERYEALSNIVDRAAMSALSSSLRGGGGPPGGLPGRIPGGLRGGPPGILSGRGAFPMAAPGLLPIGGGLAPTNGPPGGGLNYGFLMQWFPTVISAGKELIPLYLDRPGNSVSRGPGGGFDPPGGGGFRPPGGGGFGPLGGGGFGAAGGGLPFGRLPMLAMRLGGPSPGIMQPPGAGPLLPLLPAILPLVGPVVGTVVHPILPRPRMKSPGPGTFDTTSVSRHDPPFRAPGPFPVQLHALAFGQPPPEAPARPYFDSSLDNDEFPAETSSLPPTGSAFSKPSNARRAPRIRRKFSIDVDDELEVAICLLSEEPLPDNSALSQSVAAREFASEANADGAVEIEVELLEHRSSENCYVGQTVKARLIKDAVIGDCKVAGGALVYGRVSGFRRARRMGSSMVDRKSRFRNGLMAVHFSRIVSADSNLAITGSCPEQSTLFNNSGKFKVVQVNAHGEILAIQDINVQSSDPLPSSVLTLAKGGLQQSLGGVGSFGVLPLVMGAASVIDPRLVATKPIEDDRTPAGKRFVLGASGTMPGGTLLAAFLLKGDELELVEGDRLKVSVRPLAVTSVSSKIRTGKTTRIP